MATALKKQTDATYGTSLAHLFIRDAESWAKTIGKHSESMKDKLRKLEECGAIDHRDFRSSLDAMLELVGEEAKRAGQSLTTYRQSNTTAHVLVVTGSLWKRLSTAIEDGYKPDYDRPWATITQGATEFRRRTETPPPQEKEEIPEGMESAIDTPNALNNTPLPPRRQGRPAFSNVQKAQKLLKAFPIEDLQLVLEWLEEYITSKLQPSNKSSPKPALAE